MSFVQRGRICRLLSMLALGLLLAPSVQRSRCSSEMAGQPAFYAWNGELAGEPGTLLRQEPAPQDLTNAGWSVRVLSVSTDGGTFAVPSMVSGVLYLPKGEAPEGGWPLMVTVSGSVLRWRWPLMVMEP